MSKLPSHLGGHCNVNHLDFGAIKYLSEKFDIKSALDLGCGLGSMKYEFQKLGIDFVGIDGDFVIKRPKDVNVLIHDYNTGPSNVSQEFDLGWSTEFVEHVDEEFIPNYMEDFLKCKIVALSYAPEGKPGHHHVNCRDESYWIETFAKYGFTFDWMTTQVMREKSTMPREFIRDYGLCFINNKYFTTFNS